MRPPLPIGERIDRVADAGFETIDINFYGVENWQTAAERIRERGLDVAYATDAIAPLTDPDRRAEAISDAETLIERAEAVGASTLHPPVGAEQDHRSRATQVESAAAGLALIADRAAEAGIEVVLEPRTSREADWYFLHTVAQAVEVLDTLDHPNAGLLLDFYHEQIEAGDLITTVREHADLIGHVHCSDVPTGGPPGTGEINYETVLTALAETGYDGAVAMEFDPNGSLADARADFAALLECGR
jgi:hydroxypyruvate isomerase